MTDWKEEYRVTEEAREAFEKALDEAREQRDAALARAEAAETLLARAQDGRPKSPREENSHRIQLDYDIGQLLQKSGWLWDAIRRMWRKP